MPASSIATFATVKQAPDAIAPQPVMTTPQYRWVQSPPEVLSDAWQTAVAEAADLPDLPPLVGQILWQRGWRDPAALGGFLNSAVYVPTDPFAFGDEMTWAIARLMAARDRGEKVAIWGDFDADGLTATAVLWEGLGQFFTPQASLRYYVPNRFTESHGLSRRGIDQLVAWGCQLIVTCDTGSTAHGEIDYARDRGLDVIVTDHHTLPEVRPAVVALINPRQLPPGHPLADLSGVAVAYKLVEALYTRLPTVPQQPLETLLDLVAIGLIADLVALRGDCRHLAQVGLQTLERQAKRGVRPGIAKLLDLCKRTGDRPSDVAFGLGPRINAVSRIHGDAHFGVELLTSRDRPQAEKLALDAELANTRRKELQAAVMQQVTARLEELDLATTQVIVLADPQWSPGVLGLVASQVAQTYGRPTILLRTDTVPEGDAPLLARGSARSANQIDLYELVKGQGHLLRSFGGHPFAAGLTLPLENLPLFVEGINRVLRSQQASPDLDQPPAIALDGEVTVAALGRDLFRALKLLEPYGMGNPIPRLLLRNVQFGDVKDFALRDQRGGKQRYFKVEFTLQDGTAETPFPGHWWDHRKDEIPPAPCDVVIELDVNTFKSRYEARLIDLRLHAAESPTAAPSLDWIVDQRQHPEPVPNPPALVQCPADWSAFALARSPDQPLTLAYPPPLEVAAEETWQRLVGMAKYLARTGETVTRDRLLEKLGVSDRTLAVGLHCLGQLGFSVAGGDRSLHILPLLPAPSTDYATDYAQVAEIFLAAVREEHFRRRYFYAVPTTVLQQVLTRPDGGS